VALNIRCLWRASAKRTYAISTGDFEPAQFREIVLVAWAAVARLGPALIEEGALALSVRVWGQAGTRVWALEGRIRLRLTDPIHEAGNASPKSGSRLECAI